MQMFKNKTLLITGGTGSFGTTILQRFLNLSSMRYGYSVEMKKSK